MSCDTENAMFRSMRHKRTCDKYRLAVPSCIEFENSTQNMRVYSKECWLLAVYEKAVCTFIDYLIAS